MLELDPKHPIVTYPQPPVETQAATTPMRLVVADDHPLYRQGVIRALDAHGGFQIVGDTADGITALALIRDLEPDAGFAPCPRLAHAGAAETAGRVAGRCLTCRHRTGRSAGFCWPII